MQMIWDGYGRVREIERDGGCVSVEASRRKADVTCISSRNGSVRSYRGREIHLQRLGFAYASLRLDIE